MAKLFFGQFWVGSLVNTHRSTTMATRSAVRQSGFAEFAPPGLPSQTSYPTDIWPTRSRPVKIVGRAPTAVSLFAFGANLGQIWIE